MKTKTSNSSEKILVVGRAHSGKTRLAECLSEKLGVKLLKTCTTRSRRTPDEDTYHFYTEAEADAVPKSEKLFQTFAVDGYERWTAKTDFLEAGVAILDLTAVPQAIRLWQTYGYHVRFIYVFAESADRREMWICNAMKAGKDEATAIRTFEEREHCEAQMFDFFEQSAMDKYGFFLPDPKLRPVGTNAPYYFFGEDITDLWANTYRPGNMEAFIDRIIEENADQMFCGGYREFHNNEPLVLTPDDWTEPEWDTICKLMGLVPEVTTRIFVELPMVKCFIDPDKSTRIHRQRLASRQVQGKGGSVI